jgi:type VI secretion system protein ImpA
LTAALSASASPSPAAAATAAAAAAAAAAEVREGGEQWGEGGLVVGALAGQDQVAGAAQQREHIRQLLGQVRHWIELHEPSSPVAVLLKQADRMWGKRFSEIAHVIPPDLLQSWDRDD